MVLKGFSQDVVLDEQGIVQHYLVFTKEDGSELRLPVSEATTKELIRQVYSEPTVPLHKLAEDEVANSVEDPFDSGATEFGAEDADLPIEYEVEEDDENHPADESEVPSL